MLHKGELRLPGSQIKMPKRSNQWSHKKRSKYNPAVTPMFHASTFKKNRRVLAIKINKKELSQESEPAEAVRVPRPAPPKSLPQKEDPPQKEEEAKKEDSLQ